jgi:hypothetical protein
MNMSEQELQEQLRQHVMDLRAQLASCQEELQRAHLWLGMIGVPVAMYRDGKVIPVNTVDGRIGLLASELYVLGFMKQLRWNIGRRWGQGPTYIPEEYEVLRKQEEIEDANRRASKSDSGEPGKVQG